MYSSHSHKEKERLRHQKQVKLLNQVMEHVPKASNEPQTRVRKLRRLILYTHYLRMVHSKVVKHFPRTGDCENSVLDLISDSRKSPCKSMRNLRPKRANIVFLQADKSSHYTKKTQKNFSHAVSSHRTNKESTVLSSDSEYKIPELPPVRDVMSMQFDPEATCVSENAYHSQIDTECNVSFKDQEPSKEESLYVDKQAFINLESNLSIGKENYKPVLNSHVTGVDELSEEFSLYGGSPISLLCDDPSLVKHKSNHFNGHSQQSNILKKSKISNKDNLSNNYSDSTTLDTNQESLLNSLDSDHFQEASSDYGFFGATNDPQIAHPYYNFYYSDFPFSLASKMLPQNYMPLPAETVSSDTSSCPSNENMSDSNPSCNNSQSDSSNSDQCNTYDPGYSGDSDFKFGEKQEHLTSESMVSEPGGMDYTALSVHPPNKYTYLGKNILWPNSASKAAYDIPYSYVNSIHPHNIPFNKNAYGKPIFSDYNSKSRRKYENSHGDLDSFYLPPFNDSFPKEFPLVQPKLEAVDDVTPASESYYKENVEPFYFEEEASYPLSKYFSFDK